MTDQQELIDIFEIQRELQRIHGFPIDSLYQGDRDRIAEIYIYKAMEELIELRKTQPSSLIPMSKVQPVINRDEMIKELVDVFLYLANFMLARKISIEEFYETLKKVQANNYKKAVEKGEQK